MAIESVKNLMNYFGENDGFYNFLNSSNLEKDLSTIFRGKKKDISKIKEFSKPDIDNKLLESKLKGIQRGKVSLDKKVALENKDGFWYKPVKLFSNIVYGDLESLLKGQKIRLDNFNLETKSSLEKLGEYTASLSNGFDNLCYDWMKADSLNNRYSVKIKNLKEERSNLSLFSFEFLKNLKKKKELGKEIKLYEEKTKDIHLKKEDIQKSFSTYGVLSNKNEKDTLFIGHLKGEEDYYNQILNSTKDSILNFRNDQNTYSLESLRYLKEFNEESSTEKESNKKIILDV